MIYGRLKCNIPKQKAKQITRNFKNCDLYQVNDVLSSVPFHIIEIFDEVDDATWGVLKLFNYVIDSNIHMKCKTVRNKNTPFMTKELSKAIMPRNRLFRKYKRYPGKHTWEAYRIQRNKTVSIRRNAIRDHLAGECTGGSSNKHFWPIVKPYMTKKSSKSSNDLNIQDQDGTLVSNQTDVSNLMNQFYVSIASHIGLNIQSPNYYECGNIDDFIESSLDCYKDHSSILCISDSFSLCEFDFRLVTCSEVEEVIRNLNSGKRLDMMTFH